MHGSFSKTWGSSPLARGTPAGLDLAFGVDGLIPARAGNTYWSSVTMFFCKAHPRSRGEHGGYRLGAFPLLGSSPLARGTHSRLGDSPRSLGLIPARAGNTHRQHRVPRQHGAHPRSRGEHSRCSRIWVFRWGSSPLARGTLLAQTPRLLLLGLIPARAGNTSSTNRRSTRSTAHPRSRGEHQGSVYFRQ